MRRALRIVIALLPATGFKSLLLRLTGYAVARSARIGPCLIVDVQDFSVANNARIGAFNVFRNLLRLELGPGSVIGQWNWVSASPELLASGGSGCLLMGEQAAVTSRHYIDASGGVTIGRFTTVAGIRSTLITHGINWTENRQETKPIEIGDFCLIGSNACVAPGTRVHSRSVSGMGSTLCGELAEGSLVLQPRGAAVASTRGAFFNRTRGLTSPKGWTDGGPANRRA